MCQGSGFRAPPGGGMVWVGHTPMACLRFAASAISNGRVSAINNCSDLQHPGASLPPFPWIVPPSLWPIPSIPPSVHGLICFAALPRL